MPKQPRLEDNYRVYNEPLPLPPPPPPPGESPPPPPPPPHHLQDETIFMRPPLPLPPPPRPFNLPPHGGGGEFFDHPPPSGFDEGPPYHHHHPRHRDISPPVMIPIRDAYSPPRMPPPPLPPPLPHHHRFPHPHLHDMRPEPRRHFSPPPLPPHSSAPAHLHLIQRELLPPEPPPPPRRFDDFEVRHFPPPLPPSFHAMPPDPQESGVGGGAARLRKSRWSPPEQEIEPIPPRWVDARRAPPEDTHYEPPAHLLINQRGKMELPPPPAPNPRDESFLSFSGPFPQRVPLQGPLDDARNSVEDFSSRGGGPLTQSTVEASRDPRLRGKRSTSAVVEEEGGGEPLGPSVLGIKMDMPPSLKREDEKTTMTARGPTLADMFRNIDPTASPFG